MTGKSVQIILLALIIHHSSFIILPAQTTLRLQISPTEQTVFSQNIKDFRLKPLENQSGIAEFQLPDSASLTPLCQDLLRHFRQKSFLAVSLDSLQTATATAIPTVGAGLPSVAAIAHLHIGPEMRWVQLYPVDPED
ncbi:MAG TPA: hypothetical protein PK228_20720, partial [Saprospiraceae bacterium]|nr:hypothetical protein [Saprospiraceae bacterium]